MRAAVTRRAFVMGTVALGAIGGTPALGASATPDAGALALFDGDTEDGRRFAALAASAGLLAQDTGRDLAPLLYGERRDWARAPEAILIGVTRYADFHVAAGIARERGRRVIAARAREHGGTARLLAGSTSGLLTIADRLPAGFDAASIDELAREPGSIAWICA